MRFSADADKRIADLERRLAQLEAERGSRSIGNRGSNPIGWRVPWVRYELAADDTGSLNTLYLEPILEYGMNGSEVDSLIHRMPTAGTNGQRGFQIVGKGTWLCWLWVTFSHSYGSTYTSFHRHTGHLYPSYSASYITPLGRNEQHDPTIWSLPFTGYSGSFARTLRYMWAFNVKGAVTPAAPQELYWRFISTYTSISNGSLTTATEMPDDAYCMFVRLDSEAVRNIDMLLAGDGLEPETPP